MPKGVIRYTVDFNGMGCGDWDYPSIYEPGLFYADARPSVSGMISIFRLEDHALRDRLLQQIDSAPPRVEVKPSILDSLPSRSSGAWPWIGAGTLASLIVGFLIGRAGRSANKKSKAK